MKRISIAEITTMDQEQMKEIMYAEKVLDEERIEPEGQSDRHDMKDTDEEAKQALHTMRLG